MELEFGKCFLHLNIQIMSSISLLSAGRNADMNHLGFWSVHNSQVVTSTAREMLVAADFRIRSREDVEVLSMRNKEGSSFPNDQYGIKSWQIH